MRNILSQVKNSFYNLDAIAPVDITVELPKNQKISSDKQKGVSVFTFLIQIWGGRSAFGLVQSGIVSLWNLFGTVKIYEFGIVLNIYINNASKQYDFILFWMWKRCACLQVQLILAFNYVKFTTTRLNCVTSNIFLFKVIRTTYMQGLF